MSKITADERATARTLCLQLQATASTVGMGIMSDYLAIPAHNDQELLAKAIAGYNALLTIPAAVSLLRLHEKQQVIRCLTSALQADPLPVPAVR